MFEQLPSLAVGGILLGGVYTLLAFGLSVIFGVARVLHLAHGDFLMLSSLASYLIFTNLRSLWLVGVLALLPVFFIVGYTFERSLVKRALARPFSEAANVVIIMTLGVALALEGGVATTISSGYLGIQGGYFGISYNLPAINIGDVAVSSLRLMALAIIVAIAILLEVFLKRSYTGKAIRAVTDDREVSQLVGVNIEKISSITFGIGTFLAAIAGVFIVMISSANAYVGFPLTIKAVTIVVLGGFGSLIGSFIGAMVIGVSETIVSYYLGSTWAETVAIAILLLILIIRPRGIFGR